MVIAVAWVIMSFVGFVFALFDVVDAYSHYTLVRHGWPDHKHLTEFTRNQVFSQGARTFLLLVFLIVGINSLFHGPSGVFIFAMFAGNVVVVVTAVMSHRYRRKVFRRERREYQVNEEQRLREKSESMKKQEQEDE